MARRDVQTALDKDEAPLRAADRAMLIHHLDSEAAGKLAKLPAMTASVLLLFALGQDA